MRAGYCCPALRAECLLSACSSRSLFAGYGDTGVVYISRLALCLVRIALKLRRFRKPALDDSQAYILRASHKPSQASIYRLELSVWVTPQIERVVVLSKILALSNSLALLLTVIRRQHGNKNRTYRSRNVCHNNFVKAKVASFFTCAKAIMEYDAYDVLLKCVLLANIKRLCWTLQVVNEVMFWFTQMMCYNVYIPLLIRPDMSRDAG